MSRPGDYLSDLPVLATLLANRIHVRTVNWLHPRLERLHMDYPRARVRHRLAGGTPAQVLARTPVIRNRPNPAHGRPRRTDRSPARRTRATARAGRSR